MASFHFLGKLLDRSEELMMFFNGPATIGPIDFRMEGGMLSEPVLLLVFKEQIMSRQALFEIGLRWRLVIDEGFGWSVRMDE